MVSMLQSLPVEILEIIASQGLSVYDLTNHDFTNILRLRATCREIRVKLHRAWLVRYFTRRNLAWSGDSISNLRMLTKEEDQVNQVKTLDIQMKCGSGLLERAGLHDRKQKREDVARTLAMNIMPAVAPLKSLKEIHFEWMDQEFRDYHAPNYDDVLDHSEMLAAICKVARLCGIRVERILGLQIDTRREDAGGCDLRKTLQQSVLADTVTTLGVELTFAPLLFANSGDELQAGKNLANSINLLRSLNALMLSGGNYQKSYKWFRGAAAISLPRLSTLCLHYFMCKWNDVWIFLEEHKFTLRKCALVDLEFKSKIKTGLVHRMLEQIRDLQLEGLTITPLSFKDGRADFEPVKCHGTILYDTLKPGWTGDVKGRDNVEKTLSQVLTCVKCQQCGPDADELIIIEADDSVTNEESEDSEDGEDDGDED